MPIVPATWGTLPACALVYYAWPGPIEHQLILWAALLLIGWVAVTLALPHFGVKDPRPVVIDEVIGYTAAMIGHPVKPLTIGIAFVLFRIFDILKPPPIRQAEKLPNALGVIADDVLAGVVSNFILTGIILLKLA